MRQVRVPRHASVADAMTTILRSQDFERAFNEGHHSATAIRDSLRSSFPHYNPSYIVVAAHRWLNRRRLRMPSLLEVPSTG